MIFCSEKYGGNKKAKSGTGIVFYGHNNRLWTAEGRHGTEGIEIIK